MTATVKPTALSTPAGNELLPRHRWYAYKEAFSPTLLDLAAEQHSKKGKLMIVDPFCGSGTVPLASRMKGWSSIGVELNPFSAFISKTKLISLKPERLDRCLGAVEKAIKKKPESSLEKLSTFSHRGGHDKWLFNLPVLRGFNGGFRAATHLGGREKSLIQLALIGAAMDCSNAVRDGKCLRYRKEWKKLSFDTGDFLSSFHRRVEQMKEDLKTPFPGSGQSTIIVGDVRQTAIPQKFDICVTSPPYLNSFDYSDVYRPEMFLGGYVSDNDDLMGIRLKTLRSHLQANWEHPTRNDFGILAGEVQDELKTRKDALWNPRIPRMVQAYCEDIEKVLEGLRVKAKKSASAWIIVSTSAYAGIEVPVDLMIAEIGTRLGWRLREVRVLRQLRTSSQNYSKWTSKPAAALRLRESAVILDLA